MFIGYCWETGNGRSLEIITIIPFKGTVSVISSDPACKDSQRYP